MTLKLTSSGSSNDSTIYSFQKVISFLFFCCLGITIPFQSNGETLTNNHNITLHSEPGDFQIADLTLTLATNNTNYNIYENVTYEVVVQNLGPAVASNVSVSFPLPTGMVYSNSNATQGEYNLFYQTWEIGDLEVGQTVLLFLTLFTLDEDGPKVAFAQVQTVDQTDPDSNPGNDTDQTPDEDDEALVTIYPQNSGDTTDLRIELLNDEAGDYFDGGEMTVVVHNDGPSNATGVSVRLISSLNSIVVTGVDPSQGTTTLEPFDYNFSDENWVVGTINPGSSATLIIDLQFVDQYNSAYTYAQIQASDQSDPDSSPGNKPVAPFTPDEDDEAVLFSLGGGGPPADLELFATASQPTAQVGDQITFSITMENNGSYPSNNVSVEYLLPSGLTYVSSFASRGTYDPISGLWDIGFVAEMTYPTSSLITEATLNLIATVNNIDVPIINFAQVETGYDIDATPGNDTDQVVDEDDEAKVTIYEDGYAFPDLAITAFSNFQPFPPGGTVVTFFDLFNIGTGPTPEDFRVAVFLSTDDELSEFDYLVGERMITDVVSGPGGIPEVAIEVTAPAFLSPGDYYLFYVIDADFIIDESNENNNVDMLAIEVSSFCAGDIILTSQAEVDAIGICTEIEGNLYIGNSSSSDITDLSPLYQITSVGGYVIIENNPNLSNLLGLNSLASVGAWFFIENNASLTSLGGLFSLHSVSGTLVIRNNDALLQINDLQQLTSVGNDLFIDDNASLEDVTGLSGLISVGETFAINNNEALQTITGISSLTTTGSGLWIESNAVLTDINGFSNLNSIGSDDLSIRLNPSLPSFEPFPLLQNIGATVRIENNNALINLDGLSEINSIGNNIWIFGNPVLNDCCGIYELLDNNGIGGDINIFNNPAGCSNPQDILSHCVEQDYCESYGDFPWHEWISQVQVNTLNHSSEKSKYSDFTNLSTHLQGGSNYPIVLETSFSYTTYDEYWKVWIDFNQNGSFSDPGEMVLDQILNSPPNGTATASITGNISIPSNALAGNTRMRVSMQRGSSPSPCDVIPFGEVEDYTVTILDVDPLAELSIPNYEVIQSSGPNLCYSEIGADFGFFGGTIVNFGTVASGPFKLKITFSKDDQISPNDVLWQEFQFSGLGPNQDATGYTVTNLVPTSLDPGIYYAITQLDSDNEVPELYENNNIVISSVQLNAADFTVSQVDGIPAMATSGNTFTINSTITNLLPFPLLELSDDLPVQVFLSEDEDLNINNDLNIGSTTIDYDQFSNAPFFEGGSANVNLATTIPTSISDGDYYLFVLVGTTCETDLTNNQSDPYPIQIQNGGPVDYCESEGNYPWHEWIGKVTFANLNNASGKSKYSDFTSMTAFVETDNDYPISLQTDFSYTTYDEYWRVWIDFNQNGSFDDSGEMVLNEVLSAPPNGTDFATISGSISIPGNAFSGDTRMRVSMQRGSVPSSCGIIPFGEVEDYTINIINSFNGAVTQMRSQEVQVELFPNPVLQEVYANLFKHAGQSASIRIYNLYGHVLLDQQIDQIPNYPIRLNLNDIENGLYFLSIKVDNLKMTTKRIVVENTK